MRTYKYYWVGNRMVVTEYYNGRYQHTYDGYMTDNGYSVDIYPIKGKRSWGEIPYVGKRIPAHLMEREERAPMAPLNPPPEEYDPTAWHLPGGEQETGAQIALLKGVI